MRKSKDITIEFEGRDKGKVFRLTEMSAFDAEEWGTRATLALIPRLSQQIPEDVATELAENANMSMLSRIGILLGGISFPETRELMRELTSKCIQFVPDPHRPMPRAIGIGGSDDIEEIETIHYLRAEAMHLHTGFTLPAALFNLLAMAAKTSPFEGTSTSLKRSD